MDAAKESFLMFDMDLKKYIEMDLTFVEWCLRKWRKLSFPIARLDDVWRYFKFMQKVKKRLKMIGIEERQELITIIFIL